MGRPVVNRIKKVMLIVPNCSLPAGRINVATPPLGLMYLAAVLEKEDYDVRILDSAVEGYYNEVKISDRDVTYGLSDDTLKNEIAKYTPHLIGVTCQSSIQFNNALAVCRAAKEVNRNIPVVMGGPHSTVRPDKVLEKNAEIDFVIIGEGEYSFRDLIAQLNRLDNEFDHIDGLAYRANGTVKVNPKETLIKNLDELPFPARHLVPMEKYFKINFNQNLSFVPRSVSLMSSRGCSLHCIFCFNKNFWLNKYRVRSPENVLEEIDQIHREYKIKELQFSDDNLTADRKRALSIFAMLKKRAYPFKWSCPNGLYVGYLDDELLRLMKESGCREVRIAIESGNEDVLHDIIKKPIKLSKVEDVLSSAKKLRLMTSAFVSIGYPGETRDQILQTFSFIKKVKPGSVFLSIATPLPNTELMELSLQKGMQIDTDDYGDYEFSTANADTNILSAKQIEKLYIKNMFWLNVRLLLIDPKPFLTRWGSLVRHHPVFSAKLVANHFRRLFLR